MGEHEVDHLAIVGSTVDRCPLVHDGRECGAKAVRNVPTEIAGTVEQIPERILAHRSMQMAIARKDQLPDTTPFPGSPQNRDALRCQGNDIIAADHNLAIEMALHLGSRKAPARFFAI